MQLIKSCCFIPCQRAFSNIFICVDTFALKHHRTSLSPQLRSRSQGIFIKEGKWTTDPNSLSLKIQAWTRQVVLVFEALSFPSSHSLLWCSNKNWTNEWRCSALGTHCVQFKLHPNDDQPDQPLCWQNKPLKRRAHNIALPKFYAVGLAYSLQNCCQFP
jgi:hypothetical protein